jgi:HEAT repeat protein
VDATGDSFPSIMTLAESSIELLIERGEYDVAADTARSLEEASETPGLPEDRVLRIQGALKGLASVDNMRAVSKAMRMYQSDSPEHAACTRLLKTLGSEAIDPLLELVADEPDMASRKQLVDLVSAMAGAFVEELSARVTDGRWYVVRNVVMILGKTHDPDILPALGRTLRHSDERVRRETIRALATVPDRLASEMLIAALSDSDSQNVQLAARYLGTTRAKGAVPALREVAKGNGSGNRETAARVEAVEALGRIGSPEALPVLEQLAERRGGIRRARTREISAAADSAIAAIRNPGGVS